MTNATITFKGASRATLSRIARDALAAAGFVCSDMRYNDAHQNESFVVQNPRVVVKALPSGEVFHESNETIPGPPKPFMGYDHEPHS